VPFSNGTVFGALDNQGANTANRLTSAGSGCAATSVGTLCGNQNQTLTAPQIPTITAAGTSSLFVTTANPAVGVTAGSGAFGFNASGGGFSQSAPSTSSTNTGGQAHPIVQPTLLGLRAIKI
jgi:hypothetical protein